MLENCEFVTGKTEQQRKCFLPFWAVIAMATFYSISITCIVILLTVKISEISEDIQVIFNATNSESRSTEMPQNCAEAAGKRRQNGIYEIQVPEYGADAFKVACSEEYHCGGWTVIMQRVDGSVDFYRDWADYKQGFGNLHNEFWIGLDKLHALTNGKNQELLIILRNEKFEVREARYDHFAIASEEDGYALIELGQYSGNANDSLSYHMGEKFTTRDRKNNPATQNCAVTYGGAWWFKYCRKSNLNGRFFGTEANKGIEWMSFGDNLKFAQMMIRPARKFPAQQNINVN